jgi:hypothetical protein
LTAAPSATRSLYHAPPRQPAFAELRIIVVGGIPPNTVIPGRGEVLGGAGHPGLV